MWLLAILTLSYALTSWLLSLLATGWLQQTVLFLAYLVTTEYLHCQDRFVVPGARKGRLARLVQHYAPVRYTGDEQQTRLEQLARSKRQLMFCLAPHGPLCLGMAIGLAGHCGQLPAKISERLAIVGHWSIRLIPFVRELASVFGFISSARGPIDDALANGKHLALIPCGMRAKMQTLIERPVAPNVIVVYRERYGGTGFLSLAARNNLVLVPVLAPEENHLYDLYGTALGMWPLTLVVGDWLLLPRQPLSLRFGAPIDTATFAGDIARLEAAYYAALTKLAAPTHTVEFRYIG